jgi:hypothetical protein
MSKLAIAIAFAVCMINSPALSRVAPHSGTTTCEGRVEQHGNPDWYDIDVCSFNDNAPVGKAILATCGGGKPCQSQLMENGSLRLADMPDVNGVWKPLTGSDERLLTIKRLDDKITISAPDLSCQLTDLQTDEGIAPTDVEKGEAALLALSL